MVILEDIPSTQPLPTKLSVSMLCYARSDACNLPTLCIEPKDVPLFHLLVIQSAFTTFCKSSWSFPWFCFNHFFQYSHHFLSVTFYLNHKLQVSSCFWNIFTFFSSNILLFVSPQRISLTLLLLLSILVSSLLQSFLHQVRFYFIATHAMQDWAAITSHRREKEVQKD